MDEGFALVGQAVATPAGVCPPGANWPPNTLSAADPARPGQYGHIKPGEVLEKWKKI